MRRAKPLAVVWSTGCLQFYPDEMKFANSEALFPPRELAVALERDYEAQCKQLCYGPYPPWADLFDPK